jgi:hypothetical protein
MNEIAKDDAGGELSSLAQLRDEIRVRVHLAQLDAKDKWQELEGQLMSTAWRPTVAPCWAPPRSLPRSSSSR